MIDITLAFWLAVVVVGIMAWAWAPRIGGGR